VASIAAPPRPWIPRRTSRTTASEASPQASEERLKAASPITKIRLRPSRSANEPKISIVAASVSA
jgi:hypothetical protein